MLITTSIKKLIFDNFITIYQLTRIISHDNNMLLADNGIIGNYREKYHFNS